MKDSEQAVDSVPYVDIPYVDMGECVSQAFKTGKMELTAENAAKGLGQLALTIVNLLHELLERQAIRRMENGTLTDEEIEKVGECLRLQSEALDQLCLAFNISREELNLDLGPLGQLV